MKKFNLLKRNTTKRLFGLFVLSMIHSFSFAQADASDPRERIYQGVHDYLTNAVQGVHDDVNIVVDVNQIDSRIVIPTCSEGFNFHSDPESLASSYLTVRVSCNSSDWYLFASAKVTKTQTIVVTSSPISPDTVLSAQNLSLAEVDVNRLRHTPYTNIASLVGARLKYRVRPGQPIQSNMLCFICKGDRITISAVAGSMRVKTSGIAEQDGVIGDTIKVTNTNSQKAVIAQVASTEEVVVNL